MIRGPHADSQLYGLAMALNIDWNHLTMRYGMYCPAESYLDLLENRQCSAVLSM